MNRFPGAWPGFRGWDGGKIHFKEQDFCSYYMFKTNFSGHNKIWEAQKIGGTATECHPVSMGLQLSKW